MSHKLQCVRHISYLKAPTNILSLVFISCTVMSIPTIAQSIPSNKNASNTAQTVKLDIKEPSYLDEMVGYKLQLFKNIYVAPGSDTIYIGRGEQQNTVPTNEKNMPYLKIKLVQQAGPQGKTIDNKTLWTIERVHNNLCQVDDPSVEYIELYKSPERGSSAPWFLIIAAGNAIETQLPNGKQFLSGAFHFPGNLPVSSSPSTYGINKGDVNSEVYLHNFSTELVEEITREHPFYNGWSMWGDNKYAMQKFPYPNWCCWVSGVLDALYDVWKLQRTQPAPGKVVTLGTNYIITSGTTANHMNWQKTNSIHDETPANNWSPGKVNISITINNNGKVKSEIIDWEFPDNSVAKILADSINKLDRHPAIIFPNIFPPKLSVDERNLAIDKQRHYMGVPNLPDFESVTFIGTFTNKEQKK